MLCRELKMAHVAARFRTFTTRRSHLWFQVRGISSHCDCNERQIRLRSLIVVEPELIFKYHVDDSLKAVLTGTVLISKYLTESIFIPFLPQLQVRGSNAAWQQEGREFNSPQGVCQHSVFPNSGFYLPAWYPFKPRKRKTVDSDRRNTFSFCTSNAAGVCVTTWKFWHFPGFIIQRWAVGLRERHSAGDILKKK